MEVEGLLRYVEGIQPDGERLRRSVRRAKYASTLMLCYYRLANLDKDC